MPRRKNTLARGRVRFVKTFTISLRTCFSQRSFRIAFLPPVAHRRLRQDETRTKFPRIHDYRARAPTLPRLSGAWILLPVHLSVGFYTTVRGRLPDCWPIVTLPAVVPAADIIVQNCFPNTDTCFWSKNRVALLSDQKRATLDAFPTDHGVSNRLLREPEYVDTYVSFSNKRSDSGLIANIL